MYVRTTLLSLVLMVSSLSALLLVVVDGAEMETVNFDLNDPQHPKNIYMAKHAYDRRDRKMGGYNAGDGPAEIGKNGLPKGLDKYESVRVDPRNKRVVGNGAHAALPGQVGVRSPVAGISPNDYHAHVARRDEHLAEHLHNSRKKRNAVPIKVIGDDDAAKIAEALEGYEAGGEMQRKYGMGDNGKPLPSEYLSAREKKAREAKQLADHNDAHHHEKVELLAAKAMGAQVGGLGGVERVRRGDARGAAVLDPQQIVRRAKYNCRSDVISLCLTSEDVAIDLERAKDAGLADNKIRLRKRIQNFETCLARPSNINRINHTACSQYMNGRATCVNAAMEAKDTMCHIFIENLSSYHQAKRALSNAQKAIYDARGGVNAPGVEHVRNTNINDQYSTATTDADGAANTIYPTTTGKVQVVVVPKALLSAEAEAADKLEVLVARGYMYCIRAVRDGTYLHEANQYFDTLENARRQQQHQPIDDQTKSPNKNIMAASFATEEVVEATKRGGEATEPAKQKEHVLVLKRRPDNAEFDLLANVIKAACEGTDFYKVC